MDMQMGLLLRWGVMVACALMLVGGVAYLGRHGREMPAYSEFHGEPPELTTVPGILRMAASGSGRGIIQLGCLVMIATPIARVAFAAYAFARQRDWMYAGISGIVLGLLIWANS
ncbi:MAG: hypothetical protein JWO80_2348 [Bryobacterales bacterium]|nr:hypothetical protein [Bryobacterales bacterium]